MPEPIVRPSPNFDARTLPVSMLVLHYTGMADGASAIARLCDPDAKVRRIMWSRKTARCTSW